MLRPARDLPEPAGRRPESAAGARIRCGRGDANGIRVAVRRIHNPHDPDRHRARRHDADPGADHSAPDAPTGGGGKVGLLLISPFIKPNTINETGYYNHFSLFASIEDLFNAGHIAYANLPDLTVFDKTVYTDYNPGSTTAIG